MNATDEIPPLPSYLRSWLLRLLVTALGAAAFFYLQLHFASKGDLADLEEERKGHVDDQVQALKDELDQMNNTMGLMESSLIDLHSNVRELPDALPTPQTKVITKHSVRYRTIVKRQNLLEQLFTPRKKRRR